MVDQNKKSSSSLLWLTNLGIFWGIFLLSWLIILPIFWPYSTKWDIYLNTYEYLIWSSMITPYLILLGFGEAKGLTVGQIMPRFWQVTGFLLLGGVLFWTTAEALSLYQLGWLAIRKGSNFILDYPSFLAGPLLLTVGWSLIEGNSFRKTFGFLLTVLAYEAAILLGLFFLYNQIAPERFPFANLKSGSHFTDQVTIGLSILSLLSALLGTLLLPKGGRLRLHTLFTFPIWLPIFLLFFFWSLLINTTLYFMEDLLGISFDPSRFVKVVFLSVPCLFLFPLLLSIDFTLGLVRSLGQSVIEKLFPPNENQEIKDKESTERQAFGVGLLLFFTLPFWIVPVMLFWALRLFIYDSILLHFFDQIKSHQEH